MSLTRRRLFQRLATPDYSAQAEWISARGREAGMMEYGEQGMAGATPVRIASNENPLGPGQHVLDAIVGKFPEAHRYPFNARQTEGALITAIAQKFQAKNENVLLGPGSGEILGGGCVGPAGGELIHEIIVAMAQRMTVRQLAATPHYHPTLAEIWTYPAEELADRIG